VDTLAGISSTPRTSPFAPECGAVRACRDVFVASGNPDLVAGKYAGGPAGDHPVRCRGGAIATDILKAKPKGATLGIIAVQNDTGNGDCAQAVKAKAGGRGDHGAADPEAGPDPDLGPAEQLQRLPTKADFLQLRVSPTQCRLHSTR